MSHQEHFFPERMPAVFTSSKSTVKSYHNLYYLGIPFQGTWRHRRSKLELLISRLPQPSVGMPLQEEYGVPHSSRPSER